MFVKFYESGPELEILIHGCQLLYRAWDSTGATNYNLKISHVPGTRKTRAISGPVNVPKMIKTLSAVNTQVISLKNHILGRLGSPIFF